MDSHSIRAGTPDLAALPDGRRAADGRTNRLALAAAGVTVVLWASAFVAIRSAGHYFSPGALALGGLLVGGMVLGLVWLGRREGLPPRAAWPGITIAGVLWFGVYMVALNWGEQKVDAGIAAMITSTGPALIALLSGWLLREGFPPGLLAGIAVSFGGAVVVGISASSAGRAPTSGILLCALAAAVSYSTSHLLALHRSARVPAWHRTLVSHTQRGVPGPPPNRGGVFHLGVRAGPYVGRENGRHRLRRTGANGADVRDHPW